VLWKPSAPDVIGWDSPWGRGRPGWHIECSAMIEKHLGTTIDIHGGGLDLIFPHHENEIAQSRCAHGGAALARHWMHNGFLSMAGSEKMSKSLGNVVTVDALLREGHRGETLRAALLSTHYRKPLEWSEQLLVETRKQLDYFYNASRLLKPAAKGRVSPEFMSALTDDLNTSLALATLNHHANATFSFQRQAFEAYGRQAWAQGEEARSLARRHAGYLKGGATVLGLLTTTPDRWFQGEFYFGSYAIGPEQVDALIQQRLDAKKRRDFDEADRIREELAAQRILLEDGPQGTTWRRA
jgi:cysteinyl-tRNA synthetase